MTIRKILKNIEQDTDGINDATCNHQTENVIGNLCHQLWRYQQTDPAHCQVVDYVQCVKLLVREQFKKYSDQRQTPHHSEHYPTGGTTQASQQKGCVGTSDQ